MKTSASATPPTASGDFSLSWARKSGLVDQLAEQVASKLRLRKRRRQRTATASALVLFLAFTGIWAVPYVRDTNTIASPVAQRQALVLADGSHADLNAQTSLHTDFRYGRRNVRLDKGEAFFSVAKDIEHPFLVETPVGTIRVTGTQFNVRVIDQARAEVTLLEGKVMVEHGTPVALMPGQQLDFGSSSSLRTLDPEGLSAATAWRQGRMVLDRLTLAEAARRLGLYHGVTLTVAPDIAELPTGGTYPLDDLPGFLAALEAVLPVRAVPQGKADYVLVRR